MKRVAVRVTGRVQGVFFRDSTQRTALGLGLTGWVRNERDGSVAVEAQGPPSEVDQFVTWLHGGPRQARVIDVGVTDLDPIEHESGFRIF